MVMSPRDVSRLFRMAPICAAISWLRGASGATCDGLGPTGVGGLEGPVLPPDPLVRGVSTDVGVSVVELGDGPNVPPNAWLPTPAEWPPASSPMEMVGDGSSIREPESDFEEFGNFVDAVIASFRGWIDPIRPPGSAIFPLQSG